MKFVIFFPRVSVAGVSFCRLFFNGWLYFIKLLVSVCLPRCLGRLGVPNLEVRNISLLLRWWWCLYEETNYLWSLTVMQIWRKGTNSEVPKLWVDPFFGSNCWRLGKLGLGILFPFGLITWNGSPLAGRHSTQQRIILPSIFLKEAQHMSWTFHQI